MRIKKIKITSILLIVIACLLSGCTRMGVDKLDRGILAKPEMQFDYRLNDQAIDEHIYFSKEASSGGKGFGGGGCGCN
ncbi:MAG: DUF4266 domain-containing protein [Candidatus Zixiibacteriota bacterium]